MAYPQETGNLSLEGVRTGLLGTGEGLVQERVGEGSLEPRVSRLSVHLRRGKTTCFCPSLCWSPGSWSSHQAVHQSPNHRGQELLKLMKMKMWFKMRFWKRYHRLVAQSLSSGVCSLSSNPASRYTRSTCLRSQRCLMPLRSWDQHSVWDYHLAGWERTGF